jgi:hypothetical protein
VVGAEQVGDKAHALRKIAPVRDGPTASIVLTQF